MKKITRKGQKLEVTVYACPERLPAGQAGSRRVDGGLFELTYTKPTGGAIDPDRHYNTRYLKDGSSTIATRRIGQNVDDDSPWTKYYLEDHTSAALSAGLGNSTVLLGPSGNLVKREELRVQMNATEAFIAKGPPAGHPIGETSFGSYA